MKIKGYILFAVALVVMASCAKKKEDTTVPTNLLPLVSPVVEKPRPAGLIPVSLMAQGDLSNYATASIAQDALFDFFNDTVGSISGYTKSGFIATYIYDLDKRIQEITSRQTEPTCLSTTGIEVPFTTGITGHEVTLKIQCVRAFGGAGDLAGAGSGLAFGRDADYVYMYLMLAQASNTDDKFGYAVKMHRVNETVEMLFLQRSVTYNRVQLIHLTTSASPKRYEVVYAGTSAAAGPVQTQTAHIFDPGVRVVATDAAVRAEGTVAERTTSTGATQGTTGAFDAAECFSATSLTTAPVACDSSAPSFSTSMNLVLATALPAQATTIADSLKTMASLLTLGASADN